MYLDSLEPDREVIDHYEHRPSHTKSEEYTCGNAALLDDARR
jgi:hypothetical protein